MLEAGWSCALPPAGGPPRPPPGRAHLISGFSPRALTPQDLGAGGGGRHLGDRHGGLESLTLCREVAIFAIRVQEVSVTGAGYGRERELRV